MTDKKTKDQLIQERLACREFKVGDDVTYQGSRSRLHGVIVAIKGNEVEIGDNGNGYNDRTDISTLTHFIDRIGVDPFIKRKNLQSFNTHIDGLANLFDFFPEDEYSNKSVRKTTVMSGIKVAAVNWNPFVYIKGQKHYYQREFCWTLENKQNLIQSIYLGLDCGKILARHREWSDLESMAKAGESELAFVDVVDGKQRMNALCGFMRNEYPDLSGNYYKDFSLVSERRFTNSLCFTLALMGGNSAVEMSDQEIIEQFLLLNVAGVPQSTEHINNVSKILDIARNK